MDNDGSTRNLNSKSKNGDSGRDSVYSSDNDMGDGVEAHRNTNTEEKIDYRCGIDGIKGAQSSVNRNANFDNVGCMGGGDEKYCDNNGGRGVVDCGNGGGGGLWWQ